MFSLGGVGLEGWLFVSRFGEMQLLLPAAVAAVLMLVQKHATKPLAVGWMAALALAILATTVSKVAFIGWGIGIPDIDFTGISGHTMLAMAVYPLLFSTLASQLPPLQQRLSVAAGFVLALLVGQSRLEIDVHSVSEVLAGAMVGGAVSLSVLLNNRLPRKVTNRWLAVVFCGFFGVSLLSTSQINPHSWVTEFALMLSGTTTPYTRATVKRLQVLKLQPFQTSQPVPISFYAAIAFHPPTPNLPASW